MVVVALLALLLLLALVAIGLLGRAHHALRSGARSAAEADPVTGLPGRPRFRADLDARLADGGPTTLLLARLDGFAAYDAAFGHRAGDALLVRLADELRRAVRDEAIAYRPQRHHLLRADRRRRAVGRRARAPRVRGAARAGRRLRLRVPVHDPWCLGCVTNTRPVPAPDYYPTNDHREGRSAPQ